MEATIAADRPAELPATAAVPYVDVHETHTGLVVLAGDRAYKAKKPVLTDFLDFRTPEQRERACLREVELNSRLSPGSYLGVGHLDDPAGGPAEPIVVMRRYRDSDRLASLVTRGKSVEGVLDRIADMLASFHQRGERSRLIDAQGSVDAIDQRWRENLSELHRYAEMPVSGVSGDSIDRMEHLVAEFTSAVDLFSCAGSKRAALSTATATCSPTIFSARMAKWLCSTAWSSTINSATSIASMTPLFSRWTWSSWAARTLATTSWSATSRPLRRFGAVVAAGFLHRLSRGGTGQGRLREMVAG